MISLCTTVKNRSRIRVGDRELQLFPNCVRSVVNATGSTDDIELVVADWQSDDWPLSEWLAGMAAPVPVQVVDLEGHFSRGRGLNRAAAAARGEILFFIDADSLLCERVLRRGAECVRAGQTYFPVLFSFSDPDHREGWWRHEGYGHCMLSRSLFNEVGGWPEYATWGKEDDDFFGKLAQITGCVREEVPAFFHQWHPEERLWKDRYSSQYPFLKEETERVQHAWGELHQLVPKGGSLILVDETRFGESPDGGCTVMPFLEREGQYWGPPPDDVTAIAELERMRQQGAHYLAFGWMAFWWLDYYRDFAAYLGNRCRLLVKNERLLVFALDERPAVKKPAFNPVNSNASSS